MLRIHGIVVLMRHLKCISHYSLPLLNPVLLLMLQSVSYVMFLFEQYKIIEEEFFFLFIHFLVCQMYLTIKGPISEVLG